MVTEKRVKHIWNPASRRYEPEQIRYKNVKTAWEKFTAWPTIHKLGLAGIILRLYQLAAAPFWYDEGVSVVIARLSWPKMIEATAGDVHPPGYYLILWGLDKIGIPVTELTARLPSFIFSIAAVYLAWQLADLFKLEERAKIILTAWVIISPLQLHYAQEARMYALLQLEVLLAIWLLLKRKKALLSAVLILMLYTHNYAVFYLPTLALAALVMEYGPIMETAVKFWKRPIYILARMYIRAWGIWFIIPVLAWVPWLYTLAAQMKTVSGGYWIQPVKIPSIIFVLYQLLFSYSMPPTFQGLGVLITCGLLIYTGWRIYKDRPQGWQLLTILAITPLALAVFVSVIWQPVLLFRGLIGSSIPLAALVIKALEGIKVPYKKIYAYAVLTITLLAGLAGHYLYNADNKGTTTEWVNEIASQIENGDTILSLNDNGVIAVKTYAPNLPLYKLTGCGQEPLGSLSPLSRAALDVRERNLGQLLRGYPALQHEQLAQPYIRIWFISTVAPVSPQCEIDAANSIINGDPNLRVRLIKELTNTEFSQAGIYLITAYGNNN